MTMNNKFLHFLVLFVFLFNIVQSTPKILQTYQLEREYNEIGCNVSFTFLISDVDNGTISIDYYLHICQYLHSNQSEGVTTYFTQCVLREYVFGDYASTTDFQLRIYNLVTGSYVMYPNNTPKCTKPPNLEIKSFKNIRHDNENYMTAYFETNYEKNYMVKLDLSPRGCYIYEPYLVRLPGRDNVYYANIYTTMFPTPQCSPNSFETSLTYNLSGWNNNVATKYNSPSLFPRNLWAVLNSLVGFYPSSSTLIYDEYAYVMINITTLADKATVSYQPNGILTINSNTKLVGGTKAKGLLLGLYSPNYLVAPTSLSFYLQNLYSTVSASLKTYDVIGMPEAPFVNSAFNLNTPTLENQPPILEYLKFSHYNSAQFLLELKVSDETRVFSIEFSNGVSVKYSDLVGGDIKVGVYQKFIRYSDITNQVYSLELSDKDNFITYYSEVSYTSRFELLPRFPSIYGDEVYIKNITSFTMEKGVVSTDVSNPKNIVRFSLSNGRTDINPFIILDLSYFDYENRTRVVYGAWNSSVKSYEFEVTLPTNMAPREVTVILPLSYYVSSRDLLLYNYTSFSVSSNNCDQLPPYITNIQATVANPFRKSISGGLTYIGWDLFFTAAPVKLVSSNIIVSSYPDISIVHYNLTQATIMTDTYISFTFPVSDFTYTQNYTISYIKLIDENGYTFERGLGNKENIFRGLFPSNNFDIQYINDNNAPDLTFPNITQFNISTHSININSIDESKRTIRYSALISNQNSGINSEIKDKPIIVIKSDREYYEFEVDLLDYIDKYNVRISGALVFKYGFLPLDNYDIAISKICTYSMNCLIDQRVENFNVTHEYLPYLQSYSIPSNGSELFITGKMLGGDINNFKVYVDQGKGVQQMTPKFYSGILFSLTMPSFSKAFIFVSVFGKVSNTLTVLSNGGSHPEVMCTNISCGGNGVCINGYCKCNDGWSGPNCGNKAIPQPPPFVDPKTPTTITNTSANSTSSLVSIIKIDDIYELSEVGDVVKHYPLSNWKFVESDQTDQKYLQYNYTSQLQDISTKITVTVQWFGESRVIDFAGIQQTMTPGSIKYSMTLDEYDFVSPLNRLQLVVSVEVVEMTHDQCIEKQTSPKLDDIQWVKIRVDQQSFYCRFLNRGLVDNRQVAITNQLLDGGKTNNRSSILQSRVGINIPFFEKMAVIDPDFSLIIDTDSDNENALCAKSSSSNNKIKIIVGAVVGSVFGVAIIVATTVYIIKRRNLIRTQKAMEQKLKRMT